MLYSLSVEAATLLALALAAAAPTVALAAPAVAVAAVTLAVAVAALALAVLALVLALALAATTLTAAGAPCRRRPCRQLSAKKSVKVLLMYTQTPKRRGGPDPPVVILILIFEIYCSFSAPFFLSLPSPSFPPSLLSFTFFARPTATRFLSNGRNAQVFL